MIRKEYSLSFDKAEKSEQAVRKFLLRNSDSVRLTEVHSVELGFFKIKRRGGEKDRRFIETLEKLKPFFIKKIINNKKFNDIEQSKKAKFTHYLYRLSPKLKLIINQEKLFFNYPNTKDLYGFEDPTFYKNDLMIGSVITHEPIIIMYLTVTEKSTLEKKGVVFD